MVRKELNVTLPVPDEDIPEDLQVYIGSLDEYGRATYISGYFVFKKIQLKFYALGMEGYGGPNIAATFPEETQQSLRKLGLDHGGIEELITDLQQKIMDGKAHIELEDKSNPADQ